MNVEVNLNFSIMVDFLTPLVPDLTPFCALNKLSDSPFLTTSLTLSSVSTKGASCYIKISSLSFLRTLLTHHSPEVFQNNLPDTLSCVIGAVQDTFYKVNHCYTIKLCIKIQLLLNFVSNFLAFLAK